jgi:hypothetical protein
MSPYIVVAAVKCHFDHHSIDGHAHRWQHLRNGVSINRARWQGRSRRQTFIEPFNGEIQAECLYALLFKSIGS